MPLLRECFSTATGLSRRSYYTVNLCDRHPVALGLACALTNGFERKLSACLPDSGRGFIKRSAFDRDEQRYRLSACGEQRLRLLRNGLAKFAGRAPQIFSGEYFHQTTVAPPGTTVTNDLRGDRIALRRDWWQPSR